ncbi:hypothetical protein HY572_01400 [Candidatus Micrarchaeota archaeon]|nr:hypothetical protein [Candidatus Micrarchaeota archaeon]
MKTKKALNEDELREKLARINRKLSALTPEKAVAPTLADLRQNRKIREPDTEQLRQLLQERAKLEEQMLNDWSAGRSAGSFGAKPKTKPYASNFAK